MRTAVPLMFWFWLSVEMQACRCCAGEPVIVTCWRTRGLKYGLLRSQATQTPVLGEDLEPGFAGLRSGARAASSAFLPMSQCLVRTAQRVGVLQPFLVYRGGRETIGMRGIRCSRTVVVIDAEKRREVSRCRILCPCDAVVPSCSMCRSETSIAT